MVKNILQENVCLFNCFQGLRHFSDPHMLMKSQYFEDTVCAHPRIACRCDLVSDLPCEYVRLYSGDQQRTACGARYRYSDIRQHHKWDCRDRGRVPGQPLRNTSAGDSAGHPASQVPALAEVCDLWLIPPSIDWHGA